MSTPTTAVRVCFRGHLQTAETVAFSPDGRARCRLCAKEHRLERYARTRTPGAHRGAPVVVGTIAAKPPEMPDAPCAARPNLMWVQGYGERISPKEVAAMREVCAACPYRAPCLEYAIEHREAGFWGGTTAQERKDAS